ncbi:serine/arginine repetitive matrix protein 4 [Alosa sapidissima]|uniref:serine/arginine repetitive matrix protein 4 n=1 Tax=Alosa sapidissima TaxID=34773 RepID=UPI001C086847|nr:serine/arginine repetitive matrix protein 4 [Alosa sapidissima]
MTSVREHEKLLFEKFWQGTFKAVAMPRPESVIVASITAGRTLTKSDTSVSVPPKVSERSRESGETAAVAKQHNRRAKKRGRKHRSHHHSHHHSHHRARSVSFDGDLSPRPKRKKKKKKSERKRRRERAPSCSPSPVRRKKKKKKKSSKKRKQHRTASKKRKHSSSTLKHKRREERKHKKRSRSHTHRRRRHTRSGAQGSAWNTSNTDSRQHLHASDPFQPNPVGLGDARHLDADQRALDWGTAVKLASKTPPHFSCSAPDSTISQSKPGGEVVHKRSILADTLSNQNKGPQDYDSGNDTSSPPSSKTGVSMSNVSRVKSTLGRVDGDSASDSGNSVTSYVSLCKPVESTSTSSLRPGGSSAVCKTPRRERRRTRTLSSSRSRSSTSSRYSDSSYSRSPSRSPGRRSYSRSSAYSLDSRDGSVCSDKLSKHSPSRVREWSKDHSPSEKQSKHGKKRRRRKSYSPMRKRRRDSPSHLEARRITSARKRPIPYFRPSPSSCSRASSISSLGSLFGIIRSASRSHSRSRSRSWSGSRSRSRSRSRSHSGSYSSYRSYSRSSSWDSTCGGRSRSRTRSRTRSRSRSYDSLGSYSRGRR